MRSSTTPPSSAQQSVYWAWPGAIRPRSAVRQRSTNAAAPGPGDRQLAEMAHVEDPDGRAHRRVLGDGPARVGDRHRPPAEGAHRRAEGDVPVVQRAGDQGGGLHRATISGEPLPGRNRRACSVTSRPQHRQRHHRHREPPHRQQQRQQHAQHRARREHPTRARSAPSRAAARPRRRPARSARAGRTPPRSATPTGPASTTTTTAATPPTRSARHRLPRRPATASARGSSPRVAPSWRRCATPRRAPRAAPTRTPPPRPPDQDTQRGRPTRVDERASGRRAVAAASTPSPHSSATATASVRPADATPRVSPIDPPLLRAARAAPSRAGTAGRSRRR